MVLCHFEEYIAKLSSVGEKKMDVKDYLTDFLPKWLKPLEAILAKRGDWYTGSGVTFADLAVMVSGSCFLFCS